MKRQHAQTFNVLCNCVYADEECKKKRDKLLDLFSFVC